MISLSPQTPAALPAYTTQFSSNYTLPSLIAASMSFSHHLDGTDQIIGTFHSKLSIRLGSGLLQSHRLSAKENKAADINMYAVIKADTSAKKTIFKVTP